MAVMLARAAAWQPDSRLARSHKLGLAEKPRPKRWHSASQSCEEIVRSEHRAVCCARAASLLMCARLSEFDTQS